MLFGWKVKMNCQVFCPLRARIIFPIIQIDWFNILPADNRSWNVHLGTNFRRKSTHPSRRFVPVPRPHGSSSFIPFSIHLPHRNWREMGMEIIGSEILLERCKTTASYKPGIILLDQWTVIEWRLLVVQAENPSSGQWCWRSKSGEGS